MKICGTISLILILQRISMASENGGRSDRNDDSLADYYFVIDDDPAVDGCNSDRKEQGKAESFSPQKLATKIAQNAVIIARTATSMQKIAGSQASRLVRERLAEKAAEAARAAEAELHSKADFLAELEEQNKKAKAELIDKEHYLKTASTQALMAEKVRRETEDQYSTLKYAIQAATKNLDSSESTAQGAMAGLNIQKDILVSRKCYLEKVMAALKKAREDLEKAEKTTKQIMKDSQEIMKNLKLDEAQKEATKESGEGECGNEQEGEKSKELPENNPAQPTEEMCKELLRNKPKEPPEQKAEAPPKPKCKTPKKKPEAAAKPKCKPKKKPEKAPDEKPEESAAEKPEESAAEKPDESPEDKPEDKPEESPNDNTEESLEENFIESLKNRQVRRRGLRRHAYRNERFRNFRLPL